MIMLPEKMVFFQETRNFNDCVLKTFQGFLLILLPTSGIMTMKRILDPFKVWFHFNQRYIKSGWSSFTLGKKSLLTSEGSWFPPPWGSWGHTDMLWSTCP